MAETGRPKNGSDLEILPNEPYLFFPQNHPISLKLTEDNYLVWKQHMLSAVRGYGLEGFLTGEEFPPPRMLTSKDVPEEKRLNPAYTKWQMQDQRLSHWIQCSLSENIMTVVVGLSSSQEIWHAIETSFASQSKAKIMQYKLQLQTVKKESLSMRAYLQKVKNCCDLLGSAGCCISEEDQIMHILTGLGGEYDPVVVVIASQADTWTVANVSSLLMSFESRLESKSLSIHSDGSLPSVNFVSSGNQRKEANYRDGAPHFRSDGARSSNFRGRGGRGARGGRSGGNKLTCQLCQKPGHSADKCWNIQSYVPNVAPQNRSQGNFSNNYHQGNQHHTANVAHIRGSQGFPPSSSQHVPSEYGTDAISTSSWYPDSGATNHVSNDFSNLNSATDYTGGKLLHLGDGKGINLSYWKFCFQTLK